MFLNSCFRFVACMFNSDRLSSHVLWTYDCASSHVCHPFFMSYHSRIIHGITLMHTSHSCIIVTETPESETVEPTEFVEPELGVELVADPEENQGKQLSMIPCAYLNWCNLYISLGYYWVIYILYYLLHSCTYFYALPFLDIVYPYPCHMLVITYPTRLDA